MRHEVVRFTGLDIDPDDLNDRWHKGVIPVDWTRCRFVMNKELDIPNPVTYLNRWITENCQGRWSIWVRFNPSNKSKEVNLSFENDCDAIMFEIGDGRNVAFEVTKWVPPF